MRDTVRRFVKNDLEPISQQVEEQGEIPESIVQKMRDLGLFGLAIPEIKEDEMAILTLFLPEQEFIFEEKMIRSKSKNSPFIGKKLKGKIVGIINKSTVQLN